MSVIKKIDVFEYDLLKRKESFNESGILYNDLIIKIVFR